jgi:hypothetical protein
LLAEEEIPIVRIFPLSSTFTSLPQGIKGKYVFALTSGPMEKEEKFQKVLIFFCCAISRFIDL